MLEIKPEIEKFDKLEPLRGISAHFMNLQFDLNLGNPSGFMIRKYNKRRDLPFAYTQFIKFKSNRPVRNAYNVIISQVLPILYLSNNDQSAIDEIMLLIYIMERNGFQRAQLLHKVHSWLAHGYYPASRVNIVTILDAIGKPL